jgi:hypothetical protein
MATYAGGAADAVAMDVEGTTGICAAEVELFSCLNVGTTAGESMGDRQSNAARTRRGKDRTSSW